MNTSRRILLTGATGYIGSQLALALVQRGDNVHALCRNNSRLDPLQSAIEHLTIHYTDGSFDSLNATVALVAPAIVVHVASLVISEHRPQQVHDLVTSNVGFPSVLLEAMAQNGVKRIVNTGTSWQHYDADDPCFRPTNLYAATKQAFEDVLDYYVQAHGFSALSLIIFDTFGPNDPRKKLFSLFAAAQLTNQPLQMSAGDQQIDLVYIDDVTRAYCQAITHVQQIEGVHLRFSVKSHQQHNLKDIARAYELASQKPLPIQWGARPYRAREVFTPWQSGETLPNWAAQVSLEEGIALILEHLANHAEYPGK